MLEANNMNKPSAENNFLEELPANMHLYEGCGNMLGVVHLDLAGYVGDKDEWQHNFDLRKMLTNWGRQIDSDSVIVLTGDPRRLDEQGYHVSMAVFEPRGDDSAGLDGGISTMCGNGVRAVAAYIKEFIPDIDEVTIATLSGLRKIKVEKSSNGEDLFVVDMGEFSDKSEDLAKYVRVDLVSPNPNGRYLDSDVPEEIRDELKDMIDARRWSIGINGDRNGDGKMDGEPHLVVEIPRDQVEDIEDLRRIAVAVGPIITKNRDLFPEEMNANFVVLDGIDEERRFVIWNCTHERNLGADPDHSVTASCGTGSTVAGGIMFKKYIKDSSQIVLVKNTGGDLEIALDKDDGSKNLLMKGSANRV